LDHIVGRLSWQRRSRQHAANDFATMFEGDVVHDSTAVLANVKDYDRSMASVVAAFICDPILRWLFPAMVVS
jgi:hypothetical protein